MATDHTDSASHLLDTLSQRVDLLVYLMTETADKPTLVDELEHSRSTIDRAVRELEAADLVEYRNGEYVPTPCGQLATAEYRQFIRRLECLTDLRPFLSYLPGSIADDLELDWLLDADLWLPEPGNPYAMVNRHVDQLESAVQFRGLLPLVGLHAHEVICQNVLDDDSDADIELVVGPDVADTLQSDPDYADGVDKMATTDQYRVFAYGDSVPCYVGILDDELVQLGVDEEGVPRALLESANENLRAWAIRQYHAYKDKSRRVV